MTGEFLGLDLLAWVVTVGIVMAGSVLQGTTGFGMGLVSAPVLVLVDPTMVPTVVLAMALPLALIMVAREWEHFDFGLARWALGGRFFGALVGSWVVVALGTKELSIVFALSLLLGVGLSLSGLRIGNSTSTSMATAGFLAGIMGTATSVGGPLLALTLQHETGARMRTMMASFIAFGGTISLVVLAAVGELHSRELSLGLILMPVTLFGLGVSQWTIGLLNQGHTRYAVLGFASVASVAILIRAL